jgi:tetratricopeptide (TPR) repeat protein
MEFRLETAGSRRALLVSSLAVAAILSVQAVIFWVASHRVDSGRAESMARAVALVPGNGEGWDRLGRSRQWDFADPSPSEAVAYYQRAVQDDPRSAHYWMDLAGAYEDVGDDASAQKAFDRARAVYPLSAEVMWNYGNFLLRRQDYFGAYKEIQRASGADPSFLPLAISRTWRATGDINQILDNALPANSEAYLQAIDFFVSIQQVDLCLAVWKRLVSLGQPIALRRTFPLMETLIVGDRAEDARRVWRDALAVSGSPQPSPDGNSSIRDGDFSADFTNGGLGWRWDAPFGAAINFDAPPPAGGKRSVRIDFSGGSNLLLVTPAQFVPVEPGRAYHFHALMRTDQISTESGMRMLLNDPNHSGGVNVLTDNLTGSRPWTAVDADFATGPETHFLVVRLMRYPGRLFDNKLSGTVWIANLSLIPAGPQPGKPTP